MAPATPWQNAITNWPLTVPFTMAPVLARYRSVISSPSGFSLRISVAMSALLTSIEMNTYRKMIDEVMAPTMPPTAPCRMPSSHSPRCWESLTTVSRNESAVRWMSRKGTRPSIELISCRRPVTERADVGVGDPRADRIDELGDLNDGHEHDEGHRDDHHEDGDQQRQRGRQAGAESALKPLVEGVNR